MKIDEAISKAESFALEFIGKIQDKNMQEAAKTAYFMDNQEELSKVLTALQRIVTGLRGQDEALSEDECLLLNRAEQITTRLRDCITAYQQSLVINNDITEEETSAQLTEETIADAMQTNQTTQQISKNMAAIAEQNKMAANAPNFNYALVCDGQITMLEAHDKNELNTMINQYANTSNFKNINLYQVTFKPVPLHQKTILSV